MIFNLQTTNRALAFKDVLLLAKLEANLTGFSQGSLLRKQQRNLSSAIELTFTWCVINGEDKNIITTCLKTNFIKKVKVQLYSNIRIELSNLNFFFALYKGHHLTT